jgi:hypothetical protein
MQEQKTKFEWPPLRSRLGLTLVTWAIGVIAILGLLFGIGRINQSAYFWSTILATIICK